MSGFSLPSELTASTVDDLIRQLTVAFYPRPSRGFEARWGVLMGITAAYILAQMVYLVLYVRGSTDGWGALWLIRRVERPSGRFLVLNPRPTWMIPLCYGLFELAYLALLYRVYESDQVSQKAWFAMRSINAPLLFMPGWLISFSGLQSFLIATESNNSRSISAAWANSIFVGGGLFLFALNMGLGIASAVLGVSFWNSYVDLRSSLISIRTSLAGRVPTLFDFAPASAPSLAFASANDKWQALAIWQYAVISLLPAGCILINLGGLALARRLHVQIKESVDVLALVEARHTSLSKGAIPLDDLGSGGATASRRRSSAFPLDHVNLDLEGGGGAGLGGGGGDEERSGEREVEVDKRKPSLTTSEVKFLARQQDEEGNAAPTSEQAKKVLALQKAMRDLVVVSTTVLLIACAFLVEAILVAIWSGNESIYKGRWPITEAATTVSSWTYSICCFFATGYLLFNSLSLSRAIAPPNPSQQSCSHPHQPNRRVPTVAVQPASSFLAHFVENARSASSAGSVPGQQEEGREVEVGEEEEDGDGEEAAAERRRMSSLTAPPSERDGRRRNSSLTASPHPPPSSGNRVLRKLSWMSMRSSGSGGSTAGGGNGGGGRGGGRDGGRGDRPASIAGQGIVITVETEEEVCNDQVCWKQKAGRALARDEEDKDGRY
ncbi:hypothetical protein JCM8547_008965 [Rhodosporidiobolus lusitaniae]